MNMSSLALLLGMFLIELGFLIQWAKASKIPLMRKIFFFGIIPSTLGVAGFSTVVYNFPSGWYLPLLVAGIIISAISIFVLIGFLFDAHDDRHRWSKDAR